MSEEETDLRAVAADLQRQLKALRDLEHARQAATQWRAARGRAEPGGRLLDPGGNPIDPSLLGAPADAVLAVPATGQKLYRWAGDDLAVKHFLSYAMKGKRPYPRQWPVLYDAISMFGSLAQARSRSNRKHLVVAEVTLVEGAGFHVAKTLSPGHFSVWGDPEALLAVSSIASDQ